ncbi:MAG: DNA polymerase ligase N-terminal domain-containing protein, partial [Actinomycetota bacterium]
TRLHYDLRLEREGVLACWAVPRGLPTAPGEKRLAVKTEDHPLAYADFEGWIPEGNYGAGEMLVVDRGTYESLEWSDAKVSFRLRGARHQGEYHMVKTARGWLVFLAKGQATQPSDPPEFSPMLPEGGHDPFDDPGWRFEPRLEGVRTLAYVSPEATWLVSRTGADQTARYPELGRLAPYVNAASAVIDGVIVSVEAGLPSSELGRRMNLTSPQDIEQVRNEVPVKLFAVDLVWLDGADLTGKPLEERRRLLEQIVTEGQSIGLTSFVDGDGRRLFEESRRLGLEGVVAKRLGSPNLPGERSPDWRTVTARAAPLLVVDAPSLLYRAFFALPRTITGPDGQAVNALLGTANLILAAVETHAPRAVMVCFGAEAAQYRVELYPGYHADRPPMPAGLEPQWAAAPAFFDAFGWDVIGHDTLEADDLLGSLAAVEAEAEGRALLFTGDRDMFQCVGERVAVLFPRGAGKDGSELVDADGVRRRYGIEPEQVADFIALRGDPSDGLPGARGVGEKTARDLLRTHGSLEGVIAGALGERTRVADALREDAELLRAFREIAQLRRVDLPRPTDRPSDFAGAAAAARARGMNRLAERSRPRTPRPRPIGLVVSPTGSRPNA